MDQIVEQLIAARKKAGLSLEDIQQRTKIPLRQLQYLEARQFGKIGPSVYIKGFIRRYAQEVGIYPETLWEQADEVTIIPPRSTRNKKQPKRVDFAPLLRILVIVVLLAVVGFLIHTALDTFLAPDPPEPPDVPPEQQEPQDEDEDELPPEPEDEPEPEAVVTEIEADDSEAIYIIENVQALELSLEFTSFCWTWVTADGERIDEGIFQDDTKSYNAEEVIRVRFGAPKFVSVIVNGVNIETPDLQKGFSLEIRLEEASD